MIANLVGAADAGKYIAGLDLVRQTLMMPAISAAAAFFPLAVLIHANQGQAAVRAHLGECAELLFSITLPACLGFAVIAPHIANVVLGVDFRETAAEIMPIIAVAVVFQILTQQYLHVSFLLSGRNSFYLINTVSIIAANVILSYVLISEYSVVGAAWARLGADVFGFACALILSRRAFPIPDSAWPAGIDDDCRIDDGAGGRRARPQFACVGPGRMRHPGFRRAYQLRGAVLGVRHLPASRALEERPDAFQVQARKHGHRIDGRNTMNKNVATDFSYAVPVDGTDARALLSPATVHPKSLLDLPSGEARRKPARRPRHPPRGAAAGKTRDL